MKKSKKNSAYTVYRTYVDNKTGEIVETTEEYTDNLHDNNNLGKDFSAIYKQILKLLLSGMSKGAIIVMLFMIAYMDYGNKVRLLQKDICKELNMLSGNVSNAINELIDNDFCIKYRNKYNNVFYLVNPEYAHKGKNVPQTRSVYNQEKKKQQDELIKRAGKVQSENKHSADECDASAEPINSSKSDTTTKSNTEENQANYKGANKKSKEYSLKELLANSQKLGNNKKKQMLEYLYDNCDENNLVHKRVKDIVVETGISKPTVINFLTYLEQHNLIQRPTLQTIRII